MSNFAFLSAEWPALQNVAAEAERHAVTDPRAACFHARRALETAMWWLYHHDDSLSLPNQTELASLIRDPRFCRLVGNSLSEKARLIKDLGNYAAHNNAPVPARDGMRAAAELFHFCYWLARTYGRTVKPPGTVAFDPAFSPKTSPVPPRTLAALQKLEAQMREKDEQAAALLRENAALIAGKATVDEQLQRLNAEIAQAKQRSALLPDTHDYSEAETRDAFIDLLLREAGWPLTEKRDREYPVEGMPTEGGKGFVDYVLWGDDGKPLAVIEAKRAKKSADLGKQQARLYADALEQQFGRRPLIFYTNGYEHWLWDDADYPPREVQGFYKKKELEWMIQRRATRQSLAATPINPAIVERAYQIMAIRRIGEAFERDHQRKALVVMATGAGKTRTVIALCEQLIAANWVKRVLFLADRRELVKQAVGAFKTYLPDSSPVNLVTDRNAQGRVYVSTYPTMMGLIDAAGEGQRPFGAGHFDLIIIDEAHRSVYQKYRAIFHYFDALLLGLTATPKDEIDFNTYSLFDLERGMPTDVYTLESAVAEGHLVPPRAVSVPLKFPREGIRYDELAEEEKEQWDAAEWTEDGEEPPDAVEADAVNKWLFNTDTVDKVLKHLMERGQKVAGGDRLGKTIIFAKNQEHARFIGRRFDLNYPHYKGEFASVIHCGVYNAEGEIDKFKTAAKVPHIAISVDMMDTGIDVPEVVNLVFFKLVRSRTKFWQMIGRGTRLCKDLFGPGKHKEFFYVFDYCQNLEFFAANPETVEGSLGESVGKRLFTRRLELIAALDGERRQRAVVREGKDEMETLREETVSLLRREVAAMNLDNFIVRPQRRLVEKYAAEGAWGENLDAAARDELAGSVAGLPSEMETDDEEAKRFDLSMLGLQLAVLKQSAAQMKRLTGQVREIAALLEGLSGIKLVQDQMELIQDMQTDAWWQFVTAPMLENARKRLRLLVRLIEKRKRKIIYTEFEDVMGEETTADILAPAPATYERFLEKARVFMRTHENHLSIHKLRTNEALTALDLAELERMLAEIGTAEQVEQARAESHGLGLFVRSLVGLDRQAAKDALGAFLAGGNLRANQIRFLDEIFNHLTEHGCMEVERLHESPFIDFHSQGVSGMFDSEHVKTIEAALEEVWLRAVA